MTRAQQIKGAFFGATDQIIVNPEGNRNTICCVIQTGITDAKRQAVTNPDTIISIKFKMVLLKVSANGKEYTARD